MVSKINTDINNFNTFNSGGGVTTPPETPEIDNSATTSNGKVYRNDEDDFDYKASEDVDMNNVKYITRNKKMSYYDNGVQSTASAKDTSTIVNKIQGSISSRNSGLPPGYYDYIQYDHRVSASNFINNSEDEDSIDKIFRIGDCYFVIPPEFVTVSTNSSSNSIQALRQSGSIQVKHGYAQKEIQVNLVLNGMNQINGYEVNSPFDYKYHVDGLRTLISQFKYTPFVPIENSLINLIHGIHAVSLRNITVETMEGFPEALSLTISMQEFNTKSYTGQDECLFGDMIDWDLYRYYVQLPLKEDHKCYLSKITTPTLTNDFEIKLLKQDCLGGYKLDKDGDVDLDDNGDPIPIPKSSTGYIEDDITIDITDEIYYEDILTSKDSVKITGISFSMGNTMPMMQMSAHENPTTQYLGSTDTVFSFSFETLEYEIAAKFNELNSKIQSLVLNNKEKSGIGFIKINNELVNLTCTNFLLIKSIVVSTVPGFPELHSINLECISYDSNQKENERLIVLNPFKDNRKGEKKDLISQEIPGISNKIYQDAEIEKKLLELEVYPDLVLPTYEKVDYAIVKIRDFRTKNNLLQQMSISKMAKDKCEVTGNTKLTEFGKYVDPDFYLMFPTLLTDLGDIGEVPKKIDEVIKENVSSLTRFKSDSNGSLPIDMSKFSSSTLIDIINNTGENPLSVFKVLKPKADKVTEPDYALGYEPGERIRVSKSFLNNKKKGSEEYTQSPPSSAGGGINDSSSDPVSVKKKYGNPFVDLICDRADAKCGYVYGSDGQIYGSQMKSQMENVYGYGEYNGENETSQWFGKQVFDCSGLICWALRKIGLKGEGFRTSSGNFSSFGKKISSGEIQSGDVFYNGGHAGLCIGEGKTVEAMNSTIGVAYGNVNTSKYSFIRITGLKEACDKFLISNTSFYGSSSVNKNNTSNNKEMVGNTTGIPGSNIGLASANIITPRIPIANLDTNFGSSGGASSSNTNKNSSVVLADFGGNNACDKWNKEIIKVAKSYNFDPNFIKVIIMIESSGNSMAVSSYDPPNIVGLMQIYLTYHKSRFTGSNYFDPEDNIRAGCAIFKDYGSADWVNYDLEKLMCCYNAGPGYAQNVFINGSSPMPSKTIKYIEDYKTYYAQLVANGAKSGNTITPTNGGVGNVTAGDGNAESDSEPENTGWDWKYNYDETDFRNPNAGKSRNDKSYDINIDLFGTSVLNFISDPDKKRYFSFSAKSLAKNMKLQNKENIIEFMYHDMVQYSHSGRLSRAFPGFLFIIMDQQSDWIDGKKLWTNYYVYRSVIDISVHESYDSPAHTAKVTLSNFHNNLSKIIKNPSTRDLLDDGSIQEIIYELTGAIVDEEISDKMIELKNKLRDEIYLYEGARVHIRLGYGSNLSKYPTNFNGTITNIEHGELITLIAQSEGIELVNQPITDKANQTNKDVDLPEETSNMVARMFTARENEFLNALTSGSAKINSKNGIEHFGTFYDGVNISFSEGIQYDVNPFDQSQFDIVQNIYKGTYDGIPFATPSKFLNFDGESNWRFFASGKTVWDILKMCEKSLPEFVAYPKYFGFENRMFFGVPSWLCNYKYEVEDSTGKLYVRSKAFSQVHGISSLDSIIDNNIKIDTRGLYTNFIGTYTLGGDIATTPVIMSDYKIDWSRQKTKTIDTTSCWNFGLLPDVIEKFLEWSGSFDNGKELAIRVCISELCISWKESYSGNLLVLGQPEISAYDYIYLDDNFLNMSGQISVREVVHSISISSGFTTSIVPGMIVLNKIKQSGLTNVLRSTKVIGNTYAHYIGCRFITAKIMKSISSIYSSSKVMMYLKGGTSKIANFTLTKGDDVFRLIKNGNAITKFPKVIKSLDTLVDGVKVSKLFKIGKTSLKGILAASSTNPVGWVAIASWIVVDFLIGFAITAIHDKFAYRKCIMIDPLLISMPDGTIKSYAGNVNGGVNLLPIGDTVE